MSFESSDDEAEARLLKTALQLFASLGYDGTTTGMLADAAGVTQETVLKAGGRPGLYHAAMEYANNELAEVTREALSRVSRDREGLHRLLDYHLDFYFEHPESLFLWSHRALSDAADLTDIEERYSRPVYRLIAEAFGGASLMNLDDEFRMSTNILDWCLRGFVVGGIQRFDGSTAGPEDPRARESFRAYMHRLVEALLPPEPG
ncbi:TetR/AcrR family transcriptional regulator [Spirillospora sp. CA-255316]